ncbi:MAG: 54S ribosomal protein L9, mitochondrial [Stictis urceolatum]|nr:54S ribosomal protein L9, mitochondrial [Stictis urceolata]
MPPLTSLPSSLSTLPPTFLTPRLSLLTLTQQTRSIRSITPGKKTSRFDHGHNLPTLLSSPAAALERKAYTLPPRTGLLGMKKGMSAVYDASTGVRTPVTILQIDRAQVVAHKTRRKNGYWAVQVGSGLKTPQNTTRPMLGHFATAGVSPKRHLVEFRVKDASGLPAVGTLLTPRWFKEGQFVDARADCRGMGFAGGMKRWGFGGQPASHGVSKTHRSMGSSGQGQGGGSRVYPGKKMAGNMGGQRVTVQNLKVVRVDEGNGLVVVSGCVPGPKKGLVMIQDALKKPWPDMPKVPVDVLAREASKQETATA